MGEKTTKNKKGHHKQAINNGKVIRSEEMKQRTQSSQTKTRISQSGIPINVHVCGFPTDGRVYRKKNETIRPEK